jgi:short-subunit dehydrogenase
MYGATKAFLSQFAACLAVEVKSCGAYTYIYIYIYIYIYMTA